MPYELYLVFLMWVLMFDFFPRLGTWLYNINLALNIVGFSIAVAYMLEYIERASNGLVVDCIFGSAVSAYLGTLVHKILLVLDHRK